MTWTVEGGRERRNHNFHNRPAHRGARRDGNHPDPSGPLPTGTTPRAGTAAVTVETATAPQEFTISFDGNGGANPASQTTVDGRLTSLPASTRSGYDFLGWYTAASGGTRVTTGTVFTADAILYAHWDSRDSGDGSKPTQPTGPSTDNNDGWTDIQEEIGGAEDGDTITVDMNGETEVPGEIFEEVAART